MEPGSSRPGRGRIPRGRAGLRNGSAEVAEISVILAAPGWRAAVKRPEALARRAAAAALREAGAAGAMTVLLADDGTVKRLNGQHRAKAKPTNVLSFPAAMPGHLGDVALALGVVRREAREAGRHPAAHLAHLVAHGALHLAGHDHLAAGQARRMERAEARVMRRLGLPNPWKEGRAAQRQRGGP
jgi:probable rRNA maturation factor